MRNIKTAASDVWQPHNSLVLVHLRGVNLTCQAPYRPSFLFMLFSCRTC